MLLLRLRARLVIAVSHLIQSYTWVLACCSREQATAQLKATRAEPQQTQQMLEVLQRLHQQQLADSSSWGDGDDDSSDSESSSDEEEDGPEGVLDPALKQLVKQLVKRVSVWTVALAWPSTALARGCQGPCWLSSSSRAASTACWGRGTSAL